MGAEPDGSDAAAAPHVTLETDGGFAAIPGLRRTVAVDGAALPAAERAQLAALVDGAAAAGAPPDNPDARDARRYTLSVRQEGATRQVTFADPVTNPALRALRDFVAAHGRRA